MLVFLEQAKRTRSKVKDLRLVVPLILSRFYKATILFHDLKTALCVLFPRFILTSPKNLWHHKALSFFAYKSVTKMHPSCIYNLIIMHEGCICHRLFYFIFYSVVFLLTYFRFVNCVLSSAFFKQKFKYGNQEIV